MADNPITRDFALDLKAHRIVSGRPFGEVLADELIIAGIKRFFLVASADLAARFDAGIDGRTRQSAAGRFVDVIPHVPEASVARAIEAVRESGTDGLVVFGGGSSLDTAKAVSHRAGLPIVAIPTNFSGSEVTWNFGLTADGVKQTIRNPAVLPKAVIYDAALLHTLPLREAICSGVNAIAHAIEALYAPQANPFTQSLAETGVRKMIAGLRALVDSQPLHDAMALCLTGSWLCGEVLSQVGMGLHHRICHVLGGTYGLPHASTHTVLLPYSLAWNIGHAPALAPLADLFPDRPLARGLAEFSVRGGAPASLAELGLKAEQIPEIAARVLATPVPNPRPVTVGDVQAILIQAHAGDLADAEPSTNLEGVTDTTKQ
jgi:maleylacetate reductase